MARYLYRRPSGIYAVRICVPARLRAHFGRREIHVSTGTADPNEAKVLAFAILTAWQQRVVELKNMDILNIAEGSALLTGKGFVALQEVEIMFGIARKALLNEVRNCGAELVCLADGWHGVKVDDSGDVERDFDGTFLIDDAMERGSSICLFGGVILSSRVLAITCYQEADVYNDCMFWLDAAKRKAFFCDLSPGQDVPYGRVLIEKSAVERIRTRLASGVSEEALARAKESIFRSPKDPASVQPSGHQPGLRASELVEEFLESKKSQWQPDRVKRMNKMCGRFAELMGDPLVIEIDRAMLRAYAKELQKLPLDVSAAQKRHKTTSLLELIKHADELGEERQSAVTVADYLEKLSEMLNWAVLEEFMSRNPAQGIAVPIKPKKSAHKDRMQFDGVDLAKIFSANWFADGADKPNQHGRYSGYMPTYYWMPLLGLFTGGRLNELAQLYLADIKNDGAGGWFIDFNLDGEGKMELDGGDESESEGDKSLKNTNSDRAVPLHTTLIDLGLIQYVEALKAAGHQRLFPELKHHAVKGYGKAAGSWFNERYLGTKVGIVRDGKKTYHSFRHTFATALAKANVTEHKIAQLMGHARGQTESGLRYSKDSAASELRPYVELLDFNLPAIASFQIEPGILAVKDALSRKVRHAANIAKRQGVEKVS